MWTLIITAAAAASTGAPGDTVYAASGKQKADKMICKSFPKTQSRIGRNRVCKMRSEWDYEQREQELELDQIKVDNTIHLPNDGPPF
jgi:hypothetical protein